MTDPFVAVMYRYVHDYTNAHDLSVCDEIMHPDYRIHIGGQTLGFADYKAMVEWAYERFPDLQLVVHEFVTNGERLAMHFSETATSPTHGGRRAVWEGVGLYRRAGDGRLAECRVEQDFYGRRLQLSGESERPVPTEDPQVWSVAAAPPTAGVADAVRSWLGAGSGGERAWDPVLEGAEVDVVDLFAAGDRAAFAGTARGRYAGGLHGVAEEMLGTDASLGFTGVVAVRGAEITTSVVVSDRYGLRHRLRSGGSPAT